METTEIITGREAIRENMLALDGLRHQYYLEIQHVREHKKLLEEREKRLEKLLQLLKREYNDFLRRLQPFEL